jgi:predicted dehydrogenase
MFSVKIYGAGSIGNHYAYAFRKKSWAVKVFDTDHKALIRMKNLIYPSRYGKWDSKINLMNKDDNEYYDLIVIGTPPDTHLKIANKILKHYPPKVLHIEKPFCTPDFKNLNSFLKNLKKTKTKVISGYNHTLSKNTIFAEKLLKKGLIGKVSTITSYNREYWKTIFDAHPWINGPSDSYLGFTKRGGGSLSEHSHAINIYQHFANFLKLGKINKVNANLNFVKKNKVNHDNLSILNVETEKGILGNIIQDVITWPSQKFLRIEGSKGFLEWHTNYSNNCDAVKIGTRKTEKIYKFKKKRPDDFKGQVEVINKLLQGEKLKSLSISLEETLATMLVISAALKSNKYKRQIKINYKKGFTLNSLK